MTKEETERIQDMREEERYLNDEFGQTGKLYFPSPRKKAKEIALEAAIRNKPVYAPVNYTQISLRTCYTFSLFSISLIQVKRGYRPSY
jgi:hypothetical protein